MKEELLKELLTILQQTKDFTLDQLPKVAEEILVYGWWNNLIFMVIFGLGAFVAFLFTLFCVGERDEMIGMFGGLATVIQVIIFVFSLNEFIMVQTAPRLYLIKMISGLL